jgi:hypothetical protein
MAVEFIIQASRPRMLRANDPDDDTLSDAIQTIFPMDTERAILVWNHVYVPLGYKYDVSLMADDIVQICDDILSNMDGTRLIHWPSNTFAAVWKVVWTSGVVSVEAQWNRVVGGTESILAGRPSISIPTQDFLAEWKGPLDVVCAALKIAGYTPEQITELHRLKNVVARLPRYGQLYPETGDVLENGHPRW